LAFGSNRKTIFDLRAEEKLDAPYLGTSDWQHSVRINCSPFHNTIELAADNAFWLRITWTSSHIITVGSFSTESRAVTCMSDSSRNNRSLFMYMNGYHDLLKDLVSYPVSEATN
jgi:hypothetical protein